MAQMKPISQKQAIITISDISGVYWNSIKGGKVSREDVVYNDGQQGIEQSFAGMAKVEAITLMKPFDPVNDKAVLAWIKKQTDTPTPFNVAVQPTKADLIGSQFEGSSQILYSNCVLLDYKLPDFDREATGLAKIEVTIKPNTIPTYQ